MLANLLENAVRYLNDLPVSVHVRRSGARVVVLVVDQGPGIAASEQDRIFEPFYRGRPSDGAGSPGAGLGLAIAGVRSGERRDDRGRVAPRAGDELRCLVPALRGCPGDRLSTRPAVLICDDEAQILRGLRVILRDAGYDVLPAETGEEALDAAAVNHPDAAIIDLVLPDIDGVEVCKRLREWSQLPIIVSPPSERRTPKCERWRPAPTTT